MKIKVCGITCEKDAQMAVELGADSLGFVFYPRSPRFVEASRVPAILSGLKSEVLTVGVFGDQSLQEIESAVNESGVEAIQLHGGQDPALYRHLSRKLIQVGCRGEVEGEEESLHSSPFADFFLLDSNLADEKVSEGQVRSSSHLAREIRAPKQNLILSGGLSSQNVQWMIHRHHPLAVDVCRSVEKSDGEKDHLLMEEFIEKAQSAFAKLNQERENVSHQ